MKGFIGLKGILCLFVLLLLSHTTFAGGCFTTDVNGDCFKWDNSKTIFWNPEQGCLKCGLGDVAKEVEDATNNNNNNNNNSDPFGSSGGCQLSKAQAAEVLDESNASAVAMVEAQFAKWVAVPNVKLKIQKGGALPPEEGVNLANYMEYYVPDQFYNPDLDLVKNCYDEDPNTSCLNPVIFDPNGLIVQAMLGGCQQYAVWGIGGITPQNYYEVNNLKKGQLIVNGACLGASQPFPGCGGCPRVLEDKDIEAIALHELGHFLSLDHVQLNQAKAAECIVNNSCGKDTMIATMFPILLPNGGQESLNYEDQVALAKVYPNDTNTLNSGFCSVSGTVKYNNVANGVYLRCAEVVARPLPENTDTFFTEAVATVSGAEAPKKPFDGATQSGGVNDKTQFNCSGSATECGSYTLKGLKPGIKYRIQVNKIDNNYTIDPCGPGTQPQNFVDNLNAFEVTCQAAGQSFVNKNIAVQPQ